MKLARKLKNGAVTLEKLEENQIVSKIELADFLARQEKIESILIFSEKRNKLLFELEQTKREINSIGPIQQACAQKIKDLTHNLDTWYFQPFKPIDNTITVQPIEQPVSSMPSAR